MTEEQNNQPENHTETEAVIILPNGTKASFVIRDIVPYAIFSRVKSHPDMTWYTNFSIKTIEGKTITPDYDLSHDIEGGNFEGQVEILPWNSRTIFQHAQLFARIIFSLTKYSDCTDEEESLISWIIRTLGKSNSPNILPSVSEYNGILPTNFLNSNRPRIVKQFDFHKIQTLIENKNRFYQFAAITHEKEELLIETCTKGFFVSKEGEGKCYNSLFDLFKDHSKYFADNAQFVATHWSSLHVLERQPFSPFDRKNCYVIAKKANLHKLDLFDRPLEQIEGPLRDFLKIDTFPEGYLSAINEGENFYLRMIFEGVKKIANGEIQPAIEGFRTYIYKGVVISDIDVFSCFYANTEEARKEIAGFAKMSQDIQKVDNSVEIDRPIVIDYLGQRYVVIYHSDQDCVYGYGPEHDEFLRSDRFTTFITKLKELYSFKDISKTTRGFITSDGKPLLTQMGVLTPRDYNYPDPEKHGGFRIRNELIKPFEVHKALLAHKDELIQLGGLPEEDYNNTQMTDMDKLKKLSERRADIIVKAPQLEYDINALTINDENEENVVPDTVKEIADYLIKIAIPKFVDSFTTSTPYAFDGRTISTQLHKSGINLRYLGKIISLFDPNNALHVSMIQIFELEMIVRSVKKIANVKRWSLDDILNHINIIVNQSEQFDQLFEEICQVSTEKFGSRPKKPTQQMSAYLRRSLLITFGLVLKLNENGDLPAIEKANIAEIHPHLKFQYSPNFELNSRINLALNFYQTDNLNNSLKLFHSCAQIADRLLSQFSSQMMNCQYYIGLIHFQQRHIDFAFESILKSLLIQERYYDETDPDLAFKLSILGKLAIAANQKVLAFGFFSRAAKITNAFFPFHSWCVRTELDAAQALNGIDADLSVKYAQSAIESCKRINAPPQMLGNSYLVASAIACEGGKLNLATNFIEEAAKYSKSDEIGKIRIKIAQKQNKGTKRNRH